MLATRFLHCTCCLSNFFRLIKFAPKVEQREIVLLPHAITSLAAVTSVVLTLSGVGEPEADNSSVFSV